MSFSYCKISKLKRNNTYGINFKDKMKIMIQLIITYVNCQKYKCNGVIIVTVNKNCFFDISKTTFKLYLLYFLMFTTVLKTFKIIIGVFIYESIKDKTI